MSKLDSKTGQQRITRKPCPGCRERSTRPAEEVCHRCKELLREAREMRERQKQDARQLYRAPAPNDWPRIFIPGVRWTGGDYQNCLDYRLTGALAALAWRVLEGVSWEVVHERQPAGSSGYELEPIYTDRAMPGYDRQRLPVLALPDDIARIRALDEAIRAAIATAEATGTTRGSSLLGQLAAGGLSVEDFNKKTATQDPDAQARRVYRDDE